MDNQQEPNSNQSKKNSSHSAVIAISITVGVISAPFIIGLIWGMISQLLRP